MAQNLLTAALDTPGDQPVTGFTHHGQHFLINIVNTAVAGPFQIDFLVNHALAQFHHLVAIDGEQVSIHVNVVEAHVLELPQLFHDVVC